MKSFFKKKRILVAGGTGCIGIPLVKQLIDFGSNVLVVSLDSNLKAKEHFKNKVKFLKLDLTNKKNCLRAVKNKEIVINLIGIKGNTRIGERKVASYLVPMLRFQTNLIEAAYEKKIKKYVFVSSICAYPRLKLAKEESMWKGMPKQNDRIPGIAKRIGELLSESYKLEYKWNASVILRPANVYGPFDDFSTETGQVIPALINKSLQKKNYLKVLGDGKNRRDFVFSEDVAYWILKSIVKVPGNFPINIGSGKAISIKQLAKIIVKLTGNKKKIYFTGGSINNDPIRLLDIKRAKKKLSYYNKTSLINGLKKTIDWYKTQK